MDRHTQVTVSKYGFTDDPPVKSSSSERPITVSTHQSKLIRPATTLEATAATTTILTEIATGSPSEISVAASSSLSDGSKPTNAPITAAIQHDISVSDNASNRYDINATKSNAWNLNSVEPESDHMVAATAQRQSYPRSDDYGNIGNDGKGISFEDLVDHDQQNERYRPSTSTRKDAPAMTEPEKGTFRPLKKQRSVSSSLDSSENTTPSSVNNSAQDSIGDDMNDDDDSFDREVKIRSFPISLDDYADNDLSSVIQYPFGELPKSLADVSRFIKSDACQKIVILTGAGMSVVSGIPDFRSANGLYATLDANGLTATEVERDLMRLDPSFALDHRLFLQNQLPCLEVNRQFLLGTRDQIWKATLAHRFVELLHTKTGKLARLYTQNIDGLEDQCTQLPRDMVVPVHGTMDQADCALCGNEANFQQFCEDVRTKIKDITGTDPDAAQESTHIPCRICGYNTLKPSIVLFRSSLPEKFFKLVPRDVEDADLLIVIGTSLKVAPASSLVNRVPDTCLRMLVNRDPVGSHLGMQYDDLAERDYFAKGDIDSTMLELMVQLGWLEDLAPVLDRNGLPESSAQLLQAKLQEVRNNTDAAKAATIKS